MSNKTIDRVLDKLDQIDNRLNSIDKTLVKQEENLHEHMRRSDLLEKMINKNESKIEPLATHVKKMQGAGKLLVYIGVIAGIVAGIVKLFK